MHFYIMVNTQIIAKQMLIFEFRYIMEKCSNNEYNIQKNKLKKIKKIHYHKQPYPKYNCTSLLSLS